MSFCNSLNIFIDGIPKYILIVYNNTVRILGGRY